MTTTRLSVAALAAASITALPAPAQAAERTKPRTVQVEVAIDGFAMRKGRPVALASARTVAYTRNGYVRRANRRTTLAVQTAANGCRILTLRLDDLKLTLLGLTVDTSAINLRITGRRGGSLGKLFCQLASGLRLKSTARLAAVTRRLDRKVRYRKLRTLSFRAAITPQARASQAQTVCPVLDLTLGPLDLDLLGLEVDLYGRTIKDPVKVTITADPNGGALGKLFCQLSSEAQANSTA